jgi:hypothetical protein
MMRFLIYGFCAIVAAASLPANASSIVFDYSGYIASDVTYNPPAPNYILSNVFGNQLLTGTSFSVSETFNLTNATSVSNGTYIGELGDSPNFASAQITIGNISIALLGNYGDFTPTLGGFTSDIGEKGYAVGTPVMILDYSSNFTADGFQLQGNLLAGQPGGLARSLIFDVTSETLNPVPLTPALPMFASGLLALGIFGFVTRRRPTRIAAV